MGLRAAALLLVLILVPLAPVPSVGAAHDGLPEVLWLKPDPAGGRTHWLTTYGPTDTSGAELEILSAGNSSGIAWFIDYIPGGWTVEEGTETELEVWIEGLDRVIAAADPLMFIEEPGRVVIFADLVHGLDGRIGRGKTSIEPNILEPHEGPRKLTIPITVDRAAGFRDDAEESPSFIVRVTIPGHNRPETPLLAHVMSNETPSRLTVPSFPVDALRAVEAEAVREQECRDRILRREPPCIEEPPETPTNGKDPDEQVPLPWFIGLAALAVASLAALWYRRRR